MTATFYLKQSPLAEFNNIYDHLYLFSLSPKTERGFHFRWGAKSGWNIIYLPMQLTDYMATPCIFTKTGFNHPFVMESPFLLLPCWSRANLPVPSKIFILGQSSTTSKGCSVLHYYFFMSACLFHSYGRNL